MASLGSDGPHGGPFVYRSADTDMLGWVCERAVGVQVSDLIAELIWAPMGAEHDADITCDGLGSAVHDGGISASAATSPASASCCSTTASSEITRPSPSAGCRRCGTS